MFDDDLRSAMKDLAPKLDDRGVWTEVQRRARRGRGRRRGMLVALTAVVIAALAFGGFRLYEAAKPQHLVIVTSKTIAGTGSSSVRNLTVAAPVPSASPETVVAAGWGTGPGQVSMGDAFGHTKGGPQVMAISPDGKTIAVVDRYSPTPRVNFYAGGMSAGAVALADPPTALTITNDRQIYALYSGSPTTTVLHLSSNGEVLERLEPSGPLNPDGPLFWAGTSLYCVAVGGGYVWVYGDGNPTTRSPGATTPTGTYKDYPLADGWASLDKDPSGGLRLTLSGGTTPATSVHLTFAGGASYLGSLAGSSLGGLPVVQLVPLEYKPGSVPSQAFIAVDAAAGLTKTAVVTVDWKVPGGSVVVGPDGVYVMRLDASTGMQVLRWPFEASSPASSPTSVPQVAPPDPAVVSRDLLRYIWQQRTTGDAFLPFIALWPHQQPLFEFHDMRSRGGYRVDYEIPLKDPGAQMISFGVDNTSATPDVFPAIESARNVAGTGVTTDNHEWQLGETADGRLVLSVKLPAGDAGRNPYTLTIWAYAADKSLALELAASVRRYAHP